jgi:signal transduction histidine kinase
MSADANERKPGTGKSVYPALAVFVLLVLVIATGRKYMFDRYEEQAKSAAFRELADTGSLRANHLSAFLRERRGDAAVLATVLGASLPWSWWQDVHNELPPTSRRVLESILSEHGYAGAWILDAAGAVRFSADRALALSDSSKAAARRAAIWKPAALSELHSADPDAPEAFTLDTFAPIPSADGMSSVGTVLLGANREYLASLFHSLRSQGAGVEYLLVRKEGPDLLLLNDIPQGEPDLSRVPLPSSGNADTPGWASISAAQGRYGALESIDFHGRPVLAYALPVPDSNWSMVIKVDTAQALQGVNQLQRRTFYFALVFVVLVFMLLWAWLRSKAQSENALRALNLSLEQRVRERTAELETFSYSVAHDLRGPLRGIDGYSRLLLTEHAPHLNEEGRGFAQNIVRATTHMNQLIEDLLVYSRLERRDGQVDDVNPQVLVAALLEEHREEIGRCGVAVRVALDCGPIRADREGLTMALRNLLQNALKFMRDAERPALEIAGHCLAGRCVLSVRDNGVGFDMKFHDRIFVIFQRLHRSEDYPGTGVGLAIVKKAMKRMGGRVWADSAPGKGATFYLELPDGVART